MNGVAETACPRTLVGCSGWDYQSWRGSVYPRGLSSVRWLERYAQLFDTVEINATFYRLVERDTVERWVEQTPADFVFAVKASRYMTHIKRLKDIGEGVAHFYERIEPLIEAERLGPVLWQLPDNFERDDERLAGALAALPVGRHAFEFRHPSWFVDEVYELLREHDAALVLGDHPERKFQTDEATASWRYVRFHEGRHGQRGSYSDRELKAWAKRLRAWCEEADAYAYFNNDWEGIAPRNASKLREQLAGLSRARPRRVV